MDGQNFENENNVTVDTTATEVSSTAEPAQETPAAEQPANNYQDYTANVQPETAAATPVQTENKDTNVLAIVSLVLGILSIVLGCCTGWIGALFGIGGIICAVFANKQGKTGLAKGWTDLLHRRYCIGNPDHRSCSSIFYGYGRLRL